MSNSKLTIITGENNPILRKKSEEVKKFDAGLKKFAKDLKAKMMEADGVGLAAPQVGKNIRIFVAALNHKSDNEIVLAMVNPRILSHGKEMVVREEGCLSLPGIYAKVARWKELTVEFFNIEGEKLVLKLSDANARVVQHETDHIDGVLFVDRVREG